MGVKFLTYSAVLVGVYLVVANATGAGNLVKSAGTAGVGYVTALQGRK